MMVELARRVRFAVSAASSLSAPGNGYAGVPGLVGLGAFYELEITCTGEPDPATGYFLDIKVIDRAARRTLVPSLSAAVRERPTASPAEVLCEAAGELAGVLAPDLAPRRGRVLSVRWLLSPFVSVEVAMKSTGERSTTAILRQRFEIAAAHRLHVPSLSDEANRAAFGKCNNPRGHGHNYIIEPAVEVRIDAGGVGTEQAAPAFTLASLEHIVDAHILQPYDHTHLNEDTRAFNIALGGVNPSVENIAKVFYEAIAPAVADAGARLRSLRVWETEKTSAEYAG
jgi:6-pyruvoyltetrahydropterin/6-carboxytetrahydropterin synthase